MAGACLVLNHILKIPKFMLFTIIEKWDRVWESPPDGISLRAASPVI